MDTTYPYEKLGLLYLGRELDIESGAPSQQPMLFQNKNMTTHGVIIGMTGSGKTGLGITLIEEAIMDNIPSIFSGFSILTKVRPEQQFFPSPTSVKPSGCFLSPCCSTNL
jgi:hypothetical protein